MRAEIRKLEENLYLIDDAGESTAYLLCGERKAVLIDSLNGLEDLKEIVQGLTELPVTVINTHGHCDHIGGNIFFDEAWIHPADEALALSHFAFMEEGYKAFGKKPCPFRFLEIGQVFDLGGITLEVISLKGHTAGCVGLLCREKRLLFTGDGLNPHIWMQLEESLKIEVLHGELVQVKEKYGHLFDRILYGHGRGEGYLPSTLLDRLKAGCEELMQGQTEKDQPYTYFDGTAHCMQHFYGEDHGKDVIVYDVNKL